jgi:hypothetical protein
MFDQRLLALFLGLFLRTNSGDFLMALMAMVKRSDTVEVELER